MMAYESPIFSVTCFKKVNDDNYVIYLQSTVHDTQKNTDKLKNVNYNTLQVLSSTAYENIQISFKSLPPIKFLNMQDWSSLGCVSRSRSRGTYGLGPRWCGWEI